MRHTRLEHRFVKYIPEQLEPGVIYISIEYATAAHSCCCGCGLQVITPFTPTDWKLTFDGETVSLSPSIGNWNFPCRSHYIIKNSRIIIAETWSDEKIRQAHRIDRDADHNQDETKLQSEMGRSKNESEQLTERGLGLWKRVKKKVHKKRQF